MTTATLNGKELKIESLRAPGQVIVVADGTATGGTINLTNGFALGSPPSPTLGAGDFERRTFNLERLRIRKDGNQEFTFTISDWTNFNSTKIQTGDRVTLSLEPEANTLTPYQGAFPAEHSFGLSAKAPVFYGFIKSVEYRPTLNELSVLCVSAVEWSNEVSLIAVKRDDDDPTKQIAAPRVVFNVEDLASPDWLISIKKIEAGNTSALIKYGSGEPKILADARMTVGEILQYLSLAYHDDLVAQRVINAGDELFDPAEIGALTRVPGETVFQASGFGESVLRLLNAVYPDANLRVDPRTRKWHIRHDHIDMVFDGITDITAVSLAEPDQRFTVSETGHFTVGQYLRVIGDTILNQTEVAQIDQITPSDGVGEIRLVNPLPFDVQVGQTVIPLHNQANRPPVLNLDLSSDGVVGDSISLGLDLSDCYTAVSITNTRANTREEEVSFTADQESGLRIASSIEDTMRDGYRPQDHGQRRDDNGADGNGIEIHEVSVSAGVTSVWFSENSSEHGRDHAFGEWVGTGLRILTRDGQVTPIRTLRLGGVVTSFETNNPPGGGGAAGERFYRVQFDGDILTTIPTLNSVVADGTGDLFELTSRQEAVEGVVTPNRRGLVGKSFSIINSQNVTDEARLIEGGECGPIVTAGSGGSYGQLEALGSHHDLPRTYDEQVEAHEHINPHATGLDPLQRGWVMGFILPQPEPPSNADLCARLPDTSRYEPREFKMRVRKQEYSVTQVRVPETGFAGLGTMFNVQRTLDIPAAKFTNAEVQGERYGLIAEAFLARASEPRYTGQIALHGVSRWLGFSDLGFRLTFGAGNTGAVGGVVNEQRMFWGLVESVEYDLRNLQTSIGFASRDLADDRDLDQFERNLVEVPDDMTRIREEMERIRRRQACAEKTIRNQPLHRPLDCNSIWGQQTASVARAVIPSKQQGIGTARTQIGAPSITDANYNGGVGGSIAEQPDWAIEIDYHGEPFAVSVPYGSQHGGTQNAQGTVFDPVSVPTPATPVTQAQHNSEALDGLACQITSIRVPTVARSQIVRVGTGSTQTVIQLAHPIDTTQDYVGGRLAFFGGIDTERPVYEIEAVTSTTISLSAAMSEVAPSEGETAHLLGKPIPTIDQTTIPGGDFAWQDDANEWFVSNTGSGTQPVHATLGSDNRLTASGLSTMPTIRIGLPGWNVTAAGNWTFTTPPSGLADG